jgi:hypothetical protein
MQSNLRLGVEAEHITDLDYADDLVLLSGTLEGAQKLVCALEAEAAYVGLKLNRKAGKTEFTVIGAGAAAADDTRMQYGDGTEVCRVQSDRVREGKKLWEGGYKYLGSYVEREARLLGAEAEGMGCGPRPQEHLAIIHG